jgi:hypothetical protein
MTDGLEPSPKQTGTTVFLRDESWFSAMRLIRLLIVLLICGLVALVCWLAGQQSSASSSVSVTEAR